MRRAVNKFCDQLDLNGPSDATSELQRRSLEWSAVERRLLLVDLWSVQPFSPYDIKVHREHQREVLGELAGAIDARSAIAEIERCARELRNSSRLRSVSKIGGALAVGALATGGVGFMAAPFVGAALGAGAGLSGAAATSSGLAMLGGGALAAGGSGVAGGVLLVTATGAVTGGIAGGGGVAMYQLGTRQAQVELRKMEIKFKVALIQTQMAFTVAQRFATHLHEEIGDLRARLEDERRYSEKRSKRITSLERILDQFEKSESWMKEELNEVTS
jgi:hypothetical protein